MAVTTDQTACLTFMPRRATLHYRVKEASWALTFSTSDFDALTLDPDRPAATAAVTTGKNWSVPETAQKAGG